jgi:surface antigen
VTVSISCATAGAAIRYTTNGADPTAYSPLYSGPLTFSATTTLKARAFKAWMPDSSVATGTYTLAPASIRVLYPNQWLVWDPGIQGTNQAAITWTSNSVAGNVKVELSRDNGQTWGIVAASTPNDGREPWRVSGPATAYARVRVSSLSGTPSDASDGYFAIVGPYYRGFPGGYCTEYAAREFDKIAPAPVNWSGNAGQWLTNAYLAGWMTTSSPAAARPGAIAVWSGGAGQAFGHVAIVRTVTRNGAGQVTQVQIQEQNWGTVLDQTWAITTNFGRVSQTTLSVSSMNRSGSLTFRGYVLPQRR